MLIKDDVQFTVPANKIAELKAKFKFPIRIVYLPHMITYDGKNKRPNKPAGINIPCFANLKTKQGIESWRYAENKSINPAGKVKYTPHTIPFKGDMMISDLDIELVYFFYYICPYCGNNVLDDRQRKRPRFIIEDEVLKANELVDIRRNRTKVEALIYDDDIGLSEKQLKVIAKSFFIPNTEDMTKNQVRISMDSHLHKIKKGYEIFLERSRGVELLQGRAKVQTAIDTKIIGFKSNTRIWSWLLPEGKTEDICRVTGGADYIEALYDFMVGDQDFAERLEAELEGQKTMGVRGSAILEHGGNAERIE